MSFDAAWLDLREPADHAARDPRLLAMARAHLGAGLAVDLGCGTGSTLRAFRGAGPAEQAPTGSGSAAGDAVRWRLVDRDAALLRLATARAPGVETVAADLTDLGNLPLGGARLVTASALVDLASRAWIEALADRLAAEGVGLYAALTYDGAMDWDPPLARDGAVRAAFNADQRRDKGFGPALGPAAGPALAEALARRGFTVTTAPSPWRLGPTDAALQAALTDGIAAAAAAPDWGQARSAASGVSRCSVGHCDMLAIPGAPSAQSKITSRSRP